MFSSCTEVEDMHAKSSAIVVSCSPASQPAKVLYQFPFKPTESLLQRTPRHSLGQAGAISMPYAHISIWGFKGRNEIPYNWWIINCRVSKELIHFSHSYLQVTHSVAAVRDNLWPAGRGELGGHGVLHHHPLHDAPVRRAVHRLLQLAHEQRTGPHHVPAVLCLCRRLANVRVRRPHVSRISALQTTWNACELGSATATYWIAHFVDGTGRGVGEGDGYY